MLLDASAQHAGRTGREILTIAQRFMGLPKTRVDEMLDLVGLTPEESSRRVRDYSLGMRQRLGLATALIGDPSVLILDEPANGLDPAGIRWMRGLLRDFADRGGTVLLSSHLLHEIEVIADDLVVIGNGRIVAQGAKSDLLASAGAVVRTTEPHVLAAALAARGVTSSYVGTDGLLAQADADQVGRTAFAAGVPVLELRPADGTGLEEMFLQLTADTQRDTSPTTSPTTSPKEHWHDHRPAPRAHPHDRARASAGHPAAAGSRRPSFARCSTPGPASGPWPASRWSRWPRPAW